MGQSFAAVQAPFWASQRQTARQVCSHRNPGAHWAVPLQGAFSRPVRAAPAQAQSTWSMLAVTRQERPAGQPSPPRVAAAAVGSQLKAQVL